MSCVGLGRWRGSGRLQHLLLALFVALGAAGCATAPPGSGAAASAGTDAAVAAPEPQAATAPAPQAAPDVAQAEAPPVAGAIDPVRPTVVIDADDTSVNTDLWVRVRNGFVLADLDNDLVLKWQQWYASRPDYVQRMTERGGRYLFYVVEEIEKRGMPSELALLPFIESAFNPQAMSVARASGMWQFMPATGRDFDLKQNLFRDDRRDVLASTRAALDYLEMLQRQFGDWQLALAAYNWGQGNVQRAIDRNLKAGLVPTYENLRMPDETRNYVPKLQAVKNIVLRPQAFAIELPALENHPYFLTVPITSDIDVEVAVRLAGVTLEEFQHLNPQMNKPVILAAGTPQVLLPYDNATLFVRNLRKHRAPLATWTAWVSPSTMKPTDVARHVGITEEQLRSVNRIPPRMLVKAGSTLLVPRSPHRSADVPEQVADNAMMLLAPEPPPGRRVSYKAGKSGDSVAAVARRYRVSAAQVAAWNGIAANGRFKPGQTIVIVQAVPAKSAKGTKGAKRTARTATPAPRPTAAAAPARRSAAAKPARPAKVAATQGDSKL
ncbi:MAG TPA: transglycosylase SLT domain-containing protein [Rubrivivax sp.]|nr:transglycosylase SLT domain-containing protein [Rubrivivax sp.]